MSHPQYITRLEEKQVYDIFKMLLRVAEQCGAISSAFFAMPGVEDADGNITIDGRTAGGNRFSLCLTISGEKNAS